MTPLALDIAIGLVITLSTVIAYLRGIIKEVFTLVGLFVAGFLAYQGGHLLVPEFNKWLHVPDGNDKGKATLVMGLLSPSLASKVFSYGGVFLFIFLIMALLGHLLAKWTKEAGLAVVDRLLGGCFGLLRGFLLIFLLYVPCTYLI
ncbi:MAG: CvpA family protein, partial [Proteobacteria bacterium]|nr:CvpA family protein [Pseudomonadota bacterium]